MSFSVCIVLWVALGVAKIEGKCVLCFVLENLRFRSEEAIYIEDGETEDETEDENRGGHNGGTNKTVKENLVRKSGD